MLDVTTEFAVAMDGVIEASVWDCVNMSPLVILTELRISDLLVDPASTFG